eukprot:jgi/Psemu1/45885/gm1.45885_g
MTMERDKADQERKVLLQALLAQLTSGGGATRPPVTPQVTTSTAEGKGKRKLDANDSSDDNDSNFK